MLSEHAARTFRELQGRICQALEDVDGAARFREDAWEREGGGGGRSRVMTDGAVFEKAGVNWSLVHGDLRAEMADQLPGDGPFLATGVSLVLHPWSPMVPATHANFRYFERGGAAWVGGGCDLTPTYPWLEDVVAFHGALAEACAPHGEGLYPRFKAWCDEYFALPHRGETRGVGGLFFDYVGVAAGSLGPRVRAHAARALPDAMDLDRAFAFVQAVADAFLAAYLPIVERRRGEPWTEAEREFQLIRRGRYVEFNLLFDRGTVFGLRTGGRTESILMSLPPLVRWTYDYRPAPGSREAELADWLRPRDWLNCRSPHP